MRAVLCVTAVNGRRDGRHAVLLLLLLDDTISRGHHQSVTVHYSISRYLIISRTQIDSVRGCVGVSHTTIRSVDEKSTANAALCYFQ